MRSFTMSFKGLHDELSDLETECNFVEIISLLDSQSWSVQLHGAIALTRKAREK